MEKMEDKKLRALFWRIDYTGALVDGGMNSTLRGLINGLMSYEVEILFASGGKVNLPKNIKVFYIPFNKFFRNFPEIFALQYCYKSARYLKRIINEPPNFIYHPIHDFNFAAAKIKKEKNPILFVHADGVQYWIKKNWGKLYLGKLLRWAEEILWIYSDKVFTVSNNLKEMLIFAGVPSEKIIVNMNGFDPEIFHPQIDARGLKETLGLEGKFIIGFSGTFELYHGISFLAKSIKMVVRRIPQAVFLFVGDGSFRAQLDEIVKQDNVQKNTIITGFLPFEEVPKYLSICDVLVSPGINNPDGTEFFNSPIKNFEYMGLKKPIVATAVGQQKEIFKDRWNALLVEEKNPEAIAEAIWELYRNPELAQTIATNAYQDGIAKHTWAHRAKTLLDAYFSLIKK